MAEELSSVIYIGHLPEEFQEKEMKRFFKQYGTVKNVQLCRSKKTGNSKHYGFIEFETPEVAKIVAKNMENYLLFSNLLKSEVLPVSKVHPMLFKNARRGPKKEKPKTPLSKKELAFKLARYEKSIKTTLEGKGIKYEWPSLIQQFEKLGIPIPEAKTEESADLIEQKLNELSVPK